MLKHVAGNMTAHASPLDVYAGNGHKDLAMQMLEKTVSVEAHARHGNPFSDDGSSEGRHDKSPLLIGSADSSYNMDTPRRCILASCKLSTHLHPVLQTSV